MMILLDAAPSNDEMFGFFIVFGLLVFVFAVAKLFGPHDGAAQMLSQSDEGGSSPMSKMVLAFVIIFVIVWVVMNIVLGWPRPHLLVKESESIMTDQQQYEDMVQLYGPEYKFSDHKRGERIQYRAYTGEIRSGTVLWVQEPGEVMSREGKRLPVKAQYIIAPDPPGSFVDFVDLGAVLSEG